MTTCGVVRFLSTGFSKFSSLANREIEGVSFSILDVVRKYSNNKSQLYDLYRCIYHHVSPELFQSERNEVVSGTTMKFLMCVTARDSQKFQFAQNEVDGIQIVVHTQEVE